MLGLSMFPSFVIFLVGMVAILVVSGSLELEQLGQITDSYEELIAALETS